MNVTDDTVKWMFFAVVLLAGMAIAGVVSVAFYALSHAQGLVFHRKEQPRMLSYERERN